MTPSISIRPVTIVGTRFTDGQSMFESLHLEPVPSWGVFIDTADGTTSGLAPTRQVAIDLANQLVEQHGWQINHVAPEGEAEAEGPTVRQ